MKYKRKRRISELRLKFSLVAMFEGASDLCRGQRRHKRIADRGISYISSGWKALPCTQFKRRRRDERYFEMREKKEDKNTHRNVVDGPVKRLGRRRRTAAAGGETAARRPWMDDTQFEPFNSTFRPLSSSSSSSSSFWLLTPSSKLSVRQSLDVFVGFSLPKWSSSTIYGVRVMTTCFYSDFVSFNWQLNDKKKGDAIILDEYKNTKKCLKRFLKRMEGTSERISSTK